MKCYIDSREKDHAIQKIVAYFDKHGIEWEKRKLDVGDYMIEGQPDLIIDRKMSLLEMAHNMLTVDKRRFYDEIRRARASGVRLVILCEHGGIKGLEDVKAWKPRFGKSSGRKLADAIFRLEIGYGVPTFFCDPRSTGRRILEILTGDAADDEQECESEAEIHA